jgi:predicted RNase H-like HicB family nuclease
MVRSFSECRSDHGRYVGRWKKRPQVLSQGLSLEDLKGTVQDAYPLIMEDNEEMRRILLPSPCSIAVSEIATR